MSRYTEYFERFFDVLRRTTHRHLLALAVRVLVGGNLLPLRFGVGGVVVVADSEWGTEAVHRRLRGAFLPLLVLARRQLVADAIEAGRGLTRLVLRLVVAHLDLGAFTVAVLGVRLALVLPPVFPVVLAHGHRLARSIGVLLRRRRLERCRITHREVLTFAVGGFRRRLEIG